ncbi:MAG: OsmC family protein [Bacteroidetes bacterium]|nr:OsmC family protein [Bacteroidota bacterium]
MIRKSTAVWQGSGKEGEGHLSTQSSILDKTQYSYKSRFEEGKGTNPEELIAAAHAGCFTMKLSFELGGAGHTPTELQTDCEITLLDGEITQSKLILKAKVDGIEDGEFAKLVKNAEENCPVSKLLKANIVVEYTLNQ